WPAIVRADPPPVPVARHLSPQKTRPGKAAARNGTHSSQNGRPRLPTERHFHSVREGQKAEIPVCLLIKELSASTDSSRRTDCRTATRIALTQSHGRKTALR